MPPRSGRESFNPIKPTRCVDVVPFSPFGQCYTRYTRYTATSALRCRHCLKQPGGVPRCYGTRSVIWSSPGVLLDPRMSNTAPQTHPRLTWLPGDMWGQGLSDLPKKNTMHSNDFQMLGDIGD
jgi:hypothetical protein